MSFRCRLGKHGAPVKGLLLVGVETENDEQMAMSAEHLLHE
jgi:hypothetical protein